MTTEARPAQPPSRVLIVEDELMIRILLEDMLRDLGYAIAGEAGRVDEALEVANKVDFDLAILDVNLNGEPVLPVADALAAHTHIGDPVIGVAAAVLARVDLQPVLAIAALAGHGNAFDVGGRAIGKVHVDEHVARNAGR